MIIANIFAVFLAVPAEATQGQAKPNVCKSEITRSSTVMRISGPSSLLLDDGSEVVLAGIVMPTVLDIPAQTTTWQPARTSARALAQLVTGQSLQFSVVDKWRDRYGRQRVYAFLNQAGNRIWIQSHLLAQGLARAAVERISQQCAERLLKVEGHAHHQRLGLWRHAAYAFRQADKPWRLIRYRGSYQIVEGTVTAVSQLRSKTFINFGQNRRKDFTAGLFGRISQSARMNGKPLASLKGKRVRIRGWISWRGGPFIQIYNSAQIALSQTQPITAPPVPRKGKTDR